MDWLSDISTYDSMLFNLYGFLSPVYLGDPRLDSNLIESLFTRLRVVVL